MNIFSKWKDVDFFSYKASHLFFYNSVTQEAVHTFKDDMEKLKTKTPNKPIVIHIHSNGGNAELGLTLANFINEFNMPVAVIVDGYACSAITPLLLAAPYRVMHQFSFVLIHEGTYAINTVKISNAKFTSNSLFTSIEQAYINHYKTYTNIPVDILQDLLNRDLYWDADKCLMYKVIDRILDFKNRLEFKDNIDHLSNTRLKHLYFYKASKDEKDKTELYKQIYDIIKPIQDILQTKSSKQPLLLHTNGYAFPSDNWFHIATLAVRIPFANVPVYSVIDSNVDILRAIPCIIAHKRFMYANTTIRITLNFHHHNITTPYFHDLLINVNSLKKALQTILRQYTKLPKSILDHLFDSRLLLTAQDSLKYGLIDHIVDPAST